MAVGWGAQGYVLYMGNLHMNIRIGVLKNNIIFLFQQFGISLPKCDIDITNHYPKEVFAEIDLYDKQEVDLVVNALTKQLDFYLHALVDIVEPGKQLRVSLDGEWLDLRQQYEGNSSGTDKSLEYQTVKKKKSKQKSKAVHSGQTIPHTQRNEGNQNGDQECVEGSFHDSGHSSNRTSTMSSNAESGGFESGDELSNSDKDEKSQRRGNVNYYTYGQHVGAESRFKEFKRGGGEYPQKHLRNDIGKYTCAFLNGEGGTLYIGVDDSGLVHGIPCSQKEEDNLKILIDGVIKQMRPEVFPAMYTAKFVPVMKAPGPRIHKVIEIQVASQTVVDRLYEFNYHVFIRRDGSVQELGPSQIQEWIRRAMKEEMKSHHVNHVNASELKTNEDQLFRTLQHWELELKIQERKLREKERGLQGAGENRENHEHDKEILEEQLRRHQRELYDRELGHQEVLKQQQLMLEEKRRALQDRERRISELQQREMDLIHELDKARIKKPSKVCVIV